jgi:L-asparaginase
MLDSFLRRSRLKLGVKLEHQKVLVLFCGGTLVMRENEQGALVVCENKDQAVKLVLELDPKIQDEVAKLTVEFIDNVDSTNMKPEIWDRIATVIAERYNDFDGFVITHGTDTMAYTASALSWVLGDLGKPVCLTGAQIPGGSIASDARRNFVNAVRVATMQKAGVMLVFDDDIILGARSSKVSESKLDAFRSKNWDLYGEIRIQILFSDDAKDRHDRPLQLKTGFETNIAVLNFFPGFPASHFMHHAVDTRDVKGFILRGYGSGNISYEYLDALKLALEKKIPVVMSTQCWEGATKMNLYGTGKQALELGVIQGYDMSVECITTKLMWALKHADSFEEVQTLMHTNFTGELNKEGKLY